MLIKRPHHRRSLNVKQLGWIGVVFLALLSSVPIARNVFSNPSITLNLSHVHQNIRFDSETIYLYNGMVYDFYSLNENGRAGPQWQIFPLVNDSKANRSTGLPYVDHIYVTTAAKLTDRQANLQRIFAREQITHYEWRQKWKRDECLNDAHRDEVFRKLNLKPPLPYSEKRRQQCAITMEHVDIWYDIVQRNHSLALILEDDAVFVPSFREKFSRMIGMAIQTGALKIGGLTQCMKTRRQVPIKKHEWIGQDPLFVIGSCMGFVDRNFRQGNRNAPPMLSTHKEKSSRCSHGYLLTACSAEALLDQIARRKNFFVQSDILLNDLVAYSPTLQAFWLDPPIVYQGNRIHDLDGIASFRSTSYKWK